MQMQGDIRIEAPRALVWEALNDPEVLQACIPGCESLSGSPEEGFEATVKQKIGPVRATFHGAVTLSDVFPGESYRISGEGKGGVAGFARGAALVWLSDEAPEEPGGETADATRLTYEVEAKVGGKLAQLGSRIVDGFARKMADQFFANFRDRVEQRDPA